MNLSESESLGGGRFQKIRLKKATLTTSYFKEQDLPPTSKLWIVMEEKDGVR
jgi:hypothetical protein